MNVNDSQFPRKPFLRAKPRRGGGSPVLRLLLLLLATLLLAAAPTPAHAGACSNCPSPTLANLRLEAGFTLGSHPTASGLLRQDYYELDRGECVTASSGVPVITRANSFLVLRGTGEVWHCPHSKAVDAITVESSSTDSTAWSFSVKIGAEFKALAAKIKAEVEAGITTGVTITEVTSIKKTITPAWCHRITWAGWFEVGNFEAKASIHVKQRWAWWTKNRETGDKVHAKGDIWIDCGAQPIILTRAAPIAGYFALRQKGCADPACAKVYLLELGFFPLLPTHLKAPTQPWIACGSMGPVEPDPEPEPATAGGADGGSSDTGAAGGNPEPDPTTVDGD